MRTIPLPQTRGLNTELIASEAIQQDLYPFQQEVNITEGGEYLDDAIRTKDQPLKEILRKDNE